MASSLTICSDNMHVMPLFKDNQFELGSYDPPYFNGPQKLGYYGKKVSKNGVKRGKYMNGPEFWKLPTKEWFIEAKRISIYQIIWGANYYDFIGIPFTTPRGEKELSDFIEKYPRGWIVWDKCNGENSFNDYELAWTNYDVPTVVFKYMWNGMMHGKSIEEGHVMQGNKKLNEKRIHVTHKPVYLYGWLFRDYAKIPQNIFEGYLGGGSARLAAHHLNIPFYAVEMDKVIFDLQEERFQRETYNLFKKLYI